MSMKIEVVAATQFARSVPGRHSLLQTDLKGRLPCSRVEKPVGPLPDSWRIEQLRSLVNQIRSGTSVSGDDRPREEREAAVLKTSAVTSGRFLAREAKVVDPSIAVRLNVRVRRGDILMNRASGSLGMVGVCSVVDVDDDALFLPDKLWRIEPRAGVADAGWLFLALTSGKVRSEIEQFASGNSTGMKNLTQEDFLSIEVPVPPLPEQSEIAGIVGAWERALVDLDALIVAKRRRMRGIAERLLTGRVCLPGHGSEHTPDRPLRDYLQHFSTRNRENRELTALSCSKVHGIVPQTQIFDKRIASDDTRNYKVVRRGDLVYDPMLLWDASIAFLDSVDEGVISPAYATFHLNEATADRSFFRHLFDSHYMRHQYKAISQGTNTRRRKALESDFLSIEARIPGLDEQQKIAAVLDAADAELAALRDQRAALARQKKGLMQRLLTGEVRVTPDAEDYAGGGRH